jgi:aldehyde dehydrogenase (NAD+)
MYQIIDNQRTFFKTHKTKDLDYRREQLKKFEAVLRSNEKRIFDAVYSDFKKSSFEMAVTELALLYNHIKKAKKNLRFWSRKKQVPTNLLNFPAKSYIIPEPLGVCLIIGTWNYPFGLSLSPVVAAIAAGNTALIKPSELCSQTSRIMASVINDNFDPAYLKVVEGGVEETTELLKYHFDKIFFTGSTRVGQIVYQAAAKHLTPVTLELGGKTPAIITKDCNLKMTVKRLVWAKFLNAGQTCIAPDYVLVDKTIEKDLIEQVKKEISKEHFSIENKNYTQIINQQHLERIVKLIDPEKVCYGGEIDTLNKIIKPTVLQNVTFDDDIMKEEIFGPLLPIISYTDLDLVIDKVNSLPKALSCYIFTKNKKLKRKVLKEISFGGGAVNDAVMQITNQNIPFGGVGHSGIGSYHGEAGFKTFSHYKGILEKPTWFELPLKYYPHTSKKFFWIRNIMKF